MILVTGGTGLVGSHLLFDLTKSGKKVRALKRKTSDLNKVRKLFSYYSENKDNHFKNIEWIEGDILDIFSLDKAMEGVSNVYHCAAKVSFNPKEQDSVKAINAQGTANIVNVALDKKVIKLCHISSIAALGRAESNELIDEQTLWKYSKKESAYSISKHESEREVWRGTGEGLDAVIINPAIIIGPGDWENGSLRLFSIVQHGLSFYTKGVNGYIDVRDVVKIMNLLMESNIKNERFVLSSENVSYEHIFSLIADNLGKNKPKYYVNTFLSGLVWRFEKLRSLITGSDPLITKETARTATQEYYYSNEKIKKALNFEFRKIEQSIKDTCRFFLWDKKSG